MGIIRRCSKAEFAEVLEIINDAARAYAGVIPPDRYHEPYMSAGELRREVDGGVIFWGIEDGGRLAGVMGVQDKGEVTLIRHAYVRTSMQGRGAGGRLLDALMSMTDRPVLVGTWEAASWAVRFYEVHGFRLVPEGQHAALLQRYWSIPARQVETSVVLADGRWHAQSVHEPRTGSDE